MLVLGFARSVELATDSNRYEEHDQANNCSDPEQNDCQIRLDSIATDFVGSVVTLIIAVAYAVFVYALAALAREHVEAHHVVQLAVALV